MCEMSGNGFSFCRVIDGLEVLDALEAIPVKDTKRYHPVQDVKIRDVTVHANPIAASSSDAV